jgi:S-adenosylmethionine:tRNA ribosyltransferase-isomerase
VLDRSGTRHLLFRDLPKLLRSDDVLVVNETRVIAARLFGQRSRGSASVKLLLLHPAGSQHYDSQALTWLALARPARRLREGDRVQFGDFGEAAVTNVLPNGVREVKFSLPASLEVFLEHAGKIPLPPYIRNETAEAAQRYQTVFARVPGSVAAPTASLHFTPELLIEIEEAGIEIVRLTLDVGLGTFRPVSAQRLDEHVMHAESYAIDARAADAIERARNGGRRIVAVGTTAVRALEGNFQRHGRITAGEDITDIFIRPGFRFQIVEAMVTNFHLPRSTLLALVSAFAGRERVLEAYSEAIALGYRFYSFGDAMFLTCRYGT